MRTVLNRMKHSGQANKKGITRKMDKNRLGQLRKIFEDNIRSAMHMDVFCADTNLIENYIKKVASQLVYEVKIRINNK